MVLKSSTSGTPITGADPHISTASETGSTRNSVAKTTTTGSVTAVTASRPRAPVSVMIWTRMPAQVSVASSGRSCSTVSREIRQKCEPHRREHERRQRRGREHQRQADDGRRKRPLPAHEDEEPEHRERRDDLPPAHAGRRLRQLVERLLDLRLRPLPAEDESRQQRRHDARDQQRPEEPDVRHVHAGRRHHRPQADRRRRRAQPGDDEHDGGHA